jgi:hypothetical protein
LDLKEFKESLGLTVWMDLRDQWVPLGLKEFRESLGSTA